ncbi:MAG: ribonuclease III [Candidatus Neomarinimicrobiota bacterium]|nr:ribonuclease III [Candidatus Neomarinimicrobiota bacterium]
MNPLTRLIRLLIWRYVHRDEQLIKLQVKLGYFFGNPVLLRTALTHKSKEPRVSRNYEQLEFLGDAILDQLISEMLFREFPHAREGVLTQRRSTLVQKGHLAQMGKELELFDYIKAGPSLDLSQSKVSEKQLANVFESLIAAMKLDGGLKPCHRLIERTVWQHRRKAWKTLNYKGLLIEHCQANSLETPRFIVTDTEGAEHEKLFRVAVQIGSEIHATASDATKKAAEQAASQKTLERIKD